MRAPSTRPAQITRLREARPVSPMVFPDGHEGWLVTGYDAVRQLMADTRFSSRQDIGVLHVPYETPGMPAATEPSPQVPGLFIAMDPPDHTRLRTQAHRRLHRQTHEAARRAHHRHRRAATGRTWRA